MFTVRIVPKVRSFTDVSAAALARHRPERGYLPMAKLLTDLEACDYDGYLAIEHFDAPDQLSFIEQSAAFLRQWVSE